MKIITVLHIEDPEEGLVSALLKEFGWEFPLSRHPETTGNCEHEYAGGEPVAYHSVPASSGDLEEGFRRNAADVCGHCYPGSAPARLDWNWERITLTVRGESSKPERFLHVVRAMES